MKIIEKHSRQMPLSHGAMESMWSPLTFLFSVRNGIGFLVFEGYVLYSFCIFSETKSDVFPTFFLFHVFFFLPLVTVAFFLNHIGIQYGSL